MNASVTRATRASRIGLAGLAVALAVLAAAPAGAGADVLRLLVEFFVYAALASLWNLLAGYAGLVSVGQQAFVGLGGYTLFAMAILGGVNPLVAVPVAGLIAALVAVPVAALLFRLRDAYFAIGSWVVARAIQFCLLGLSLPAQAGTTAMWSPRQTGVSPCEYGTA